MTVSGTIEQASSNGYVFTNASAGDTLIRGLYSNNILLGFGCNNPSTYAITSNGLYIRSQTSNPASITLHRTNDQNASLSTVGQLDFDGTTSNGTTSTMATIGAAYGTGGADITISTDNGSGIAERMRVTNAGNVGVGTSAPAYQLDVIGQVNATAIYENGVPLTTKYASGVALLNYTTLSDYAAYSNYASSNYAPSNTMSNFATQAAMNSYSNFMGTQFATSNTLCNLVAKATATSNYGFTDKLWTVNGSIVYTYSNVGIGTSNPQYLLDVNGPTSVATSLYENGQLLAGVYVASNTLSNYLTRTTADQAYASSNIINSAIINATAASNISVWTSNNLTTLIAPVVPGPLSGPSLTARTFTATSGSVSSNFSVSGTLTAATIVQSNLSASNVAASNITSSNITAAFNLIENGQTLSSKYAPSNQLSNLMLTATATSAYASSNTATTVYNGAVFSSNASTWASNNIFPPAAVTPPGTMISFPSSNIPSGWLLCDGTAVSRTTYAPLFTAIGTTYGAGDGSTTFALPDCKGRTTVGLNPADPTYNTLGQRFGASSVTLSNAYLPDHIHTVNDPGHSHNLTLPGHNHKFYYRTNNFAGNGNGQLAVTGFSDIITTNSSTTTTVNQFITPVSASDNLTINLTGGGQPFSILNPFLVMYYIIKT